MVEKKKVLITGATGFIGANLVRRCLQKGAEVYVFTRSKSNKWRLKDILKNIHEYKVDLLDRTGVARAVSRIKPQIIFHTAIYGGYRLQRDFYKIAETNFLGTVNLLEACRQINLELLVNTGSSSEYGIKSKPMRENDLLEPVAEYGATKAAATLYAQVKTKSDGLPVTSLRLFSPYGYYEEKTRLVPTVILLCLKGKRPTIYSKNFVRDFVFIEDVIEAYFQAIKYRKKAIGEIFNISSGQQHSIDNVAKIVIKLTGNKVKPFYQMKGDHRSEPQIWQADISKAKNILKWKPNYSLEQGLAKTVRWFKQNVSLYEKD